MEKMKREIGIFILNYNGLHWLKRHLKILIEYSENAEIIIIDNKSSDRSIEYVERNFPFIHIHIHKNNFGFAKGYNKILLEENRFKYLILINNDVEVTKNWISPLFNLIQKKNIGIIQPKIKNLQTINNTISKTKKGETLPQYEKSNLFDYAGGAGGFIDILGIPFCRGRILNHIERDEGQYNDNRSVFWASGCCFMIKQTLFKKLNGFDEDLFMHQEEIDLCWRAQALNQATYFCSNSVVFHANGGTLGTNESMKKFYNHRNNLLILTKNLPFPIIIFLILFRLILDYVIIGQHLLKGIYNISQINNNNYKRLEIIKNSFKTMYYIIKAHISYFILLPKFIIKRKVIKKTKHIYKGSIMVDYIFKQKNTFSKLKKL